MSENSIEFSDISFKNQYLKQGQLPGYIIYFLALVDNIVR